MTKIQDQENIHNQKLGLSYANLKPFALIEWDIETKLITCWNSGAETTFGYKAEEVVGKAKADIIVPDYEHETLRPIWEGLKGIPGKYKNTNENIRKDGKKILCEWYNAPLVNEQGEVKGIAALAREISKD